MLVYIFFFEFGCWQCMISKVLDGRRWRAGTLNFHPVFILILNLETQHSCLKNCKINEESPVGIKRAISSFNCLQILHKFHQALKLA